MITFNRHLKLDADNIKDYVGFTIEPLTLKNNLLLCSFIASTFEPKLHYEPTDSYYSLIGHKLEKSRYSSHDVDIVTYVAISNSLEELKMYADLHCVSASQEDIEQPKHFEKLK